MSARPYSVTLGRARELAQQVAAELADRGAKAVCAVGSIARGDANRDSDIDLIAIGDGPPYRLEQRDSRLVSISWRSVTQIDSAFAAPEQVGGLVPAWRRAALLHDPYGLAAGLKARAKAWRWEDLGDACDQWVAREVTGFAEEVHRLVGQIEAGEYRRAAVMRCLLALKLAPVLAVHLRILYESENYLWELVAQQAGEQWAHAQDAAFGATANGEPLASAAALTLYGILAAQTGALLDTGQAAVVHNAVRAAARCASAVTDSWVGA
jgi:hypothetical protein